MAAFTAAGGSYVASVFLSYSREDLASARRIALALENAGHSIWWDREIRGGTQYAKEIDQALAAADVVVVLWSVHSIVSAWVRDEAEAGRDSGRLLPVTLDGSRPPLGFRQYQTIDLTRWCKTKAGREFEELLAGLNASSASPSGISSSGRTRIGRRALLTAGGSAAAIAAIGGGWLLAGGGSRSKLPREIEGLVARAKVFQEQNTTAGQYQSIGLLERVVKLAPDYADGWGKLGIAYAVPSHYRDRPEALKLRAKAEAAGRRSLELDPDCVYGEMALAIAPPFIGHWLERDRRTLRALRIEPRNDDLLALRGVVLQFDGRARESVGFYDRVKSRPFTPAIYANYIQALWSAGRLTELDDAMEDASALYPTQWTIWRNRFNILAYDSRTEAAIALAENKEGRPPDADDEYAAKLVRLARAIRSRNVAEADAVMSQQREAARGSAGGAEYAIRNASALGRVDDAFTFAEAYYFSRGYAVPDYGEGSDASLDQRQTRLLFEPVTKPMRADTRFERLVGELGLDRYWKKAGIQPDYRRA